ncbi:MAG TPA: metallophosphoesterase [Propionibacteriaceae bacterium]|nr:metallophosphoesterase [Propionibacteriaceae bacterium]
MIGRLAAAGAIAAAGCFAYGVLVERQAFTLRRVTAPVLPAGQRPMTVLHLSDLHLSTDRRNLVRWVDSLAALRPDLVVTTGDNMSQPEAMPLVYEAYGRLFSVPGVFVFGSNDYFAPTPVNPLRYLGLARTRKPERAALPHRELRAGLVARGWHDVEHRRVELCVDGRRVEVRGTKDAHIDLDRYDTVAGPPDPSAVLSIGVTHAPYLRLLDAMTADGLDLIIAGHTHGGQVCVPLYGALTTNCDLDTQRVKGLSSHTFGGRTAALHVSAGLGTSPYAPYRFACRPEATLLTLVPRTTA